MIRNSSLLILALALAFLGCSSDNITPVEPLRENIETPAPPPQILSAMPESDFAVETVWGEDGVLEGNITRRDSDSTDPFLIWEIGQGRQENWTIHGRILVCDEELAHQLAFLGQRYDRDLDAGTVWSTHKEFRTAGGHVWGWMRRVGVDIVQRTGSQGEIIFGDDDNVMRLMVKPLQLRWTQIP